MAMRMMAAVMAIGFIGLGCRHVESPAQPKHSEVPPPPEATPVDAVLWEEQMRNAAGALKHKDYALAERSCVEALKTAGKFSPADARLTTNLVYLAGIYQTENKSDLAEQTFKEAVASR